MTQKYTLNAGDKWRPNVLRNLLEYLHQLPTNKSFRIEIREQRKERTLDQNAATFGVAYAAIMEATGLEGDADRKQLHRDFCGDFFGWIDGPLGHRKPVRTTTTNEHGERDVIDTATM